MAVKDLQWMNKYNECIRNYKNLSDAVIRDEQVYKNTIHQLLELVDNRSNEIVSETLYTRFLKHTRNEKNKSGWPILFLSKADEVLDLILDQTFLVKMRSKVKEQVEKTLLNLVELTENSINSYNCFSVEIVSDPYAYTRYKCYYYFDSKDSDLLENFINKIYKPLLVPKLKSIYDDKGIYKAVNTDRFAVCSDIDFSDEKCTTGIAIKNISKLIAKLLSMVSQGVNLLSENDILYVYMTKIIYDMLSFNKDVILETEAIKVQQKAKDDEKQLEKDDDSMRFYFAKLLKGSVKTKEYYGFFTKEDYLNLAKQRFRQVEPDKLEEIFDSVVKPKPPMGVLHFSLPEKTNPKGFVDYFVALSHIPMVFDFFGIHEKNLSDVFNVQKQHFIMFMKKFFEDFRKNNMTDEKLAELMDCAVTKVRDMRSVVEKIK